MNFNCLNISPENSFESTNFNFYCNIYSTESYENQYRETLLHYFGARYYDSGLGIWLSVDPLASKYPSLSPYVYAANNPINLFDPNGMSDDWFQDNKTGEIAYHKDFGKNDVAGFGNNWSWLGEDNMFGIAPHEVYNSQYADGNATSDVLAFGLGEKSQGFMDGMGYKFADSEQFVYDKSAKEKIAAGPYSNTMITGEMVRIGKKRAYVPKGFEVLGESRTYLDKPTTYIAKSGYSGMINVYNAKLEYGVPQKNNIFNSLSKNLNIDIRSVSNYPSWNSYPKGKNSTINTFRPR
jgi:RHS repeat-associated protein